MERIAVIMGKMHSGGKKNLVMEYYRHIDKNKIQFDFICDEDSNAIPKEEIESLGGRVFVVTRYQSVFKNIIEIKQIIKNGNYRIVHAYNGTMNLFGLFAAWMGGATIRINESISMAHSTDKKTVIKNILKPFSGCFATHFMANGEVCGRWQFGDKLYDAGKVAVFKTVINVDENRYAPELRDRAREEFGIVNNFVVGHIGRLTAQKNTLFIIDIFAEILKLKDNAKLLIIGDGDLREEMISRINELGISENILYLGRREDIKQFYNAMDCFLLPSLYEGLPVVGVEAECCGLPMFFSTEIPKESNACDDIGFFISLEKTAKEWAEEVIQKTDGIVREDHSEAVKKAGFDSVTEAGKLLKYYEGLLE
jgi:glycosyltransferase involved in cell wall biosynthesis